MFCKECGTQLSDDAQFCPNCGKAIVNSIPVENTASSPPKKKPTVIMGGVLILIVAIGIFFVAGNRSDKNIAEETVAQDNVTIQESTETEVLTDIPQSTVIEPEQKTNIDKEYPIYAASLITLINEQSLPNGEIVKYIGDLESNPLQFAICDINKDGKEELLLNLPCDTCEIGGHFIYTENVENTGLEDLCGFSENAVYYETGFIKEPVSYSECLSIDFEPYDIRMWDVGGFLDAGRVEAWEKAYMTSDFSGNAFPDSIDTDGNGIVYFISGELGIDYNNPVDDAEYREYEKQFFGNGKTISVPWLELTIENIEKVTGYTEERIATENITPVYTSETYGDGLLQSEENLSEMQEVIPYVPISINFIGMDLETYLSTLSWYDERDHQYLFSDVLPLVKSTDDTIYHSYYAKGNNYSMLGVENEYITAIYFSNVFQHLSVDDVLNELGIYDTAPYIIDRGQGEYDFLIWKLDNAYLIMTVLLFPSSNGGISAINLYSVTMAQEINDRWLEQYAEMQ